MVPVEDPGLEVEARGDPQHILQGRVEDVLDHDHDLDLVPDQDQVDHDQGLGLMDHTMAIIEDRADQDQDHEMTTGHVLVLAQSLTPLIEEGLTDLEMIVLTATREEILVPVLDPHLPKEEEEKGMVVVRDHDPGRDLLDRLPNKANDVTTNQTDN